MDFISPILGCVSPYVIDPIRDRLRILRHLRDNIQELGRTADRLASRRNDQRREVEDAKKQQVGVEESDDAKRWFRQADEAVSEANVLTTQYEELQQQQRACSSWFCLGSRYRLGKTALNLKKRVDDLYAEEPVSGWTAVVASTSTSQLNTVSLEGQTGRESLKNEIIASVLDDRYVAVGLHGMGGIGKTTLLKHVYEHFRKTTTVRHFDSLIFTTVSATPDFTEMRKQIARGFGLRNCIVDDDDLKEKLSRQTGKYLLVLDDMWEPPVDIEEICIPAPTKENGCKILMSSRSLRVLVKFVNQFAERGSLHTIPVNKLPPVEAWNLFVKKVGETLIKSQEGIEPLAKEIVKKCDGLPLAITVIGSTMSTRETEGEWKDALREVKQLWQANLEGVEEEVFSILKFSFEKLTPIEKDLFLYCCLFFEDELIEKYDFYNWGIGEEAFWDKMQTLGELKNKVDVLVGNLRKSSMLEDSEYEGLVKMHDVLREFGLWLKSPEFITNKSSASNALEWSKATKISLRSVESLPQLSDDCPHLHTLMLSTELSHSMKNIPQAHFLEHVPTLKILNLTGCHGIRTLPSSISHLVSLRLLSLSECTSLEELPPEIGTLAQLTSLDLRDCTKLKGLPMEMKELKNLRHLNLKYTTMLKRIPHGLLFGLHKLEEFETHKSGLNLSIDNISELCQLAHLTSTSLNLRKVKVDSHLLKPFAKSLSYLRMWNCDIDPSFFSDFLEVSSTSHEVVLIFNSCKGLTRVPTHGYTSLVVYWCQNLKTLVMVDEEKVDENNNNIIAFRNLEWLWLEDLHELETICSGRIPLQQPLGPGSSSSCLFSNLKYIHIERCPNLKVLFTSGVIPLLVKLEHLDVYECSQLEYLMVADDNDDDDLESIINAFPRLWRIELCELPELTAICCCNNHQHLSDLMKWPSLSLPFVYLCPKLRRPPFGVQHANISLQDEEDGLRVANHLKWKEEMEKENKQIEEDEKEGVDGDLQCLD